MKHRILVAGLGISAVLALSGCDQVKSLIGGKPKGQVVATVNGEEITSLELRRELGTFTSADPKIMKQAQQQALQQIIMRDLLAQKAREAKLDKTPDYTLQVRAGEKNLLVQLYQRQLAAKAATVTKAEADAYVAAHPQQFAGRKIMIVNQVIAGPSKIDPVRFKPLKNLEDVKSLFTAEKVPFQENVITIDSLSADPRLMDQIAKLPPGEVFVVPQRGALLFNRVASSQPAPFGGEAATGYAMNLVRQQKAQTSVGKAIQDMRKAAESKIVYNPAFKPPAPAPAAKPAAGAKPAAAAAPAPTPATK